MKEEEGEEWRAMKAELLATEGDERGGCWRALNPTTNVMGEGADERGWKAARRGCFRGGRRRGACTTNRIWWVAAGYHDC